MASIIKVNGVELPAPSDFRPDYCTYDSESSGRSEAWYMHRSIIRRNLRTLECTWRLQTPDMHALLLALEPDALTVSFFDIYNTNAADRSTVFEAYVQGTKSPRLLFWDDQFPEQSWWEITLSFVEY